MKLSDFLRSQPRFGWVDFALLAIAGLVWTVVLQQRRADQCVSLGGAIASDGRCIKGEEIKL